MISLVITPAPLSSVTSHQNRRLPGGGQEKVAGLATMFSTLRLWHPNSVIELDSKSDFAGKPSFPLPMAGVRLRARGFTAASLQLSKDGATGPSISSQFTSSADPPPPRLASALSLDSHSSPYYAVECRRVRGCSFGNLALLFCNPDSAGSYLCCFI
ncbi:hypothetical protein Ancab_003028 [Ancistrocladus abbreviatus]